MKKTSWLEVLPLKTWAALVLIGVFFFQFRAVVSPGDFLLYWAAGKLFLQQANPYDAEALLSITNTIQIQPYPFVNWNPPWTLILTAPFALLPFKLAQTLWYTILVTALLWMADWFWRFRASSPDYREIAWLSIILFLPVLHALYLGQINLLVPVGLLLFYRAVEKKRCVLAGLAVLLIAAKPHLVFLFFLFLGLWCLKHRLWSILFAAALSLTLPVILLSLYNPSLLGDYVAAVGSRGGPFEWATPTLGTVLWMLFDSSSALLRMAPPIVGLCIGVLIWQNGWKKTFSWNEHLAPILLLSVCTAAYAWPHDLVVLFPVILIMLIWFSEDMLRKWWIPVGIVVAEACAYAVMVSNGSAFYGFWFPWVLAGLYWFCLKSSQPTHQRHEGTPEAC
jgi:hypothetical protein